jgi:hypothetical protein
MLGTCVSRGFLLSVRVLDFSPKTFQRHFECGIETGLPQMQGVALMGLRLQLSGSVFLMRSFTSCAHVQ